MLQPLSSLLKSDHHYLLFPFLADFPIISQLANPRHFLLLLSTSQHLRFQNVPFSLDCASSVLCNMPFSFFLLSDVPVQPFSFLFMFHGSALDLSCSNILYRQVFHPPGLQIPNSYLWEFICKLQTKVPRHTSTRLPNRHCVLKLLPIECGIVWQTYTPLFFIFYF